MAMSNLSLEDPEIAVTSLTIKGTNLVQNIDKYSPIAEIPFSGKSPESPITHEHCPTC